MIEALFRGLKNNYLYHQGIRTIEDLARKVNYYFNQHNTVIPQAVLQGARPVEVYKGSWSVDLLVQIEVEKEQALALRKGRNLSPTCSVCPI